MFSRHLLKQGARRSGPHPGQAVTSGNEAPQNPSFAESVEQQSPPRFDLRRDEALRKLNRIANTSLQKDGQRSVEATIPLLPIPASVKRDAMDSHNEQRGFDRSQSAPVLQ
jgi:hypothetical protein